jgi:hypothetical protein
LRTRPVDSPAVDPYERFDAGSTSAELDGAILAQQTLAAAAVDADDRPVGLLAAEAPRPVAARRSLGDLLQEGIRAGAEGEGFDLDLQRRQPIPIAGIPRGYPEVTRLALRKRDPVGTAIAVQAAQRTPVATVIRSQDFVSA